MSKTKAKGIAVLFTFALAVILAAVLCMGLPVRKTSALDENSGADEVFSYLKENAADMEVVDGTATVSSWQEMAVAINMDGTSENPISQMMGNKLVEKIVLENDVSFDFLGSDSDSVELCAVMKVFASGGTDKEVASDRLYISRGIDIDLGQHTLTVITGNEEFAVAFYGGDGHEDGIEVNIGNGTIAGSSAGDFVCVGNPGKYPVDLSLENVNIDFEYTGAAGVTPAAILAAGNVSLNGVSFDLQGARPVTVLSSPAGSVSYETVQDEINASHGTAPASIQLEEEITNGLVVPAYANVTLDLNGRKVTNADGAHTITNNGTLTIIGDGTVENISAGRAVILNNGEMTLAGGKYTRTANHYVIDNNKGNMTIEAGVTVESPSTFSSMIRNGGDNNAAGATPTLTIKGGTFSGGLNTVKNDDYGILYINDGSFSNTTQHVILNWSTATIEGGEFTPQSGAYAAVWTGTWYTSANFAQGVTVIKDGTFNGAVTTGIGEGAPQTTAKADYTITGGTFNAEVNSSADDIGYITGGEFAELPDATAFAAGYAAADPDSDGIYTAVDEAQGNYMASLTVDNKRAVYETLAAAIAAAPTDGTKATITLLQDEVQESITIAAEQNIILDLNGKKLINTAGQHTITNIGTLTVVDPVGGGVVDNISNGHGALVNYGEATLSGGTFTRSLEDGKDKIGGTNTYYVICNLNSGVMNITPGVSVYFNSSPEESQNYDYSSLVQNYGSSAEVQAELNITGGSFYAGKTAIKNDDYGVLTIADGLFVSPDQAVQNWWKATITGGTFEGIISNWTWDGAQRPADWADDAVSISGGIFKEKLVSYHNNTQTDVLLGNGFAITGGSFGELPLYSYFADDYRAAWDEVSEMYVTEPGGWAAVINDERGYASLKDAFAAAANGDIIVLWENIGSDGDQLAEDSSAETITLDSAISVVLDLNGKKIYSGAVEFIVVRQGTLTVRNGEIHTYGDTFRVVPLVQEETAKLVLESTLTASSQIYNAVYVRAENKTDETVINAIVETSAQLTAYGEYAAIQGNGSRGYGGVSITVLGGSVTAENSLGMYLPGYGIYTVSGGTVTGTTGIEVRNGVLNITGGTVVATGTELITEENNNGSTVNSGAAVSVSMYSVAESLEVNVSGGTLNGVYALYEANLNPNDGVIAVDALDVSLSGGTFNGEIESDNLTGFISGGKFASQPADDYFGENFAAQFYDGFFIVVKSTALTEAKYEAQADIRSYAVLLGIDLSALDDDVGETTAEAAQKLLAAYNAIMEATSTLGVAEAKKAALNAADEYSAAVEAAFEAYKATKLTDLNTALKGEDGEAGTEDDIVLPTATWFALNNAATQVDFDAYYDNAMAEITAIRNLRSDIGKQAQQLTDLAGALEEMSEGLFGTAGDGTTGAFADLLDKVQDAIAEAKNAIVNGEAGSDSLADIQNYLETQIKTALDEMNTALTGLTGENGILNRIETAVNGLRDLNIGGEFDGVLQAIEDAQNQIISGTASAEDISSAVESLTGVIKELTADGSTIDTINDTLASLNSVLAGTENNLFDQLAEELKQAIIGTDSSKTLTELAGEIAAADNVIDQVLTAVQGLANETTGIVAQIRGELDGMLEEIETLTGSLATSESVSGVRTDIAAAKTEIDKIVAAIGSLGTGEGSDLATQIGEIVTALEDVQGTVGEIAVEVSASTAVETAKDSALTDIETWINEYLDNILGTADEANSGAAVALTFTAETTEGDIYAKLARAFSEENAQLVLRYYNDALAAIDAATTVSEVTTAVSTFKAQVASVEASAQNATNVNLTGVYVLLAVMLAAVIVVLIIVLLKKNRAVAYDGGKDAEEAAPAPAAEAKAEPMQAVQVQESVPEQPAEPAEKPVESELAAEIDDDKEQVVIAANVRSFAEAYVELNEDLLQLFNKVKDYALAKEGATEVKQSSGVCIKRSGKQIVKLTVRRGYPVALYLLENEMLKDFRRSTNSSAKLKIRATELVLRDEADLDAAYTMVDLSVEQIDKDIEAAKERRREARRARRKQKQEAEAQAEIAADVSPAGENEQDPPEESEEE